MAKKIESATDPRGHFIFDDSRDEGEEPGKAPLLGSNSERWFIARCSRKPPKPADWEIGRPRGADET